MTIRRWCKREEWWHRIIHRRKAKIEGKMWSIEMNLVFRVCFNYVKQNKQYDICRMMKKSPKNTIQKTSNPKNSKLKRGEGARIEASIEMEPIFFFSTFWLRRFSLSIVGQQSFPASANDFLASAQGYLSRVQKQRLKLLL